MKTSRFALVPILGLALSLAATTHSQQKPTNSNGIFTGSADIGKTLRGSSIYDAASGSYRIAGGGADMWADADDFHLTWVQITGDGSLSADVRFDSSSDLRTESSAAQPLAKGVLMVRQSLDPGSAYADVAIHRDGHITLQYRTVAGGKTEDTVSPDHGSVRLKIERKGNLFTAYSQSADGTMRAFSSTTVAMDGPVLVGLGACSHDVNSLATVTFSNVALKQGTVTRVGRSGVHHVVVWDGETANRGSGWVNPTTSTIGPQHVEVHSGNTALEFRFKGHNQWLGAGWNWFNFKTGDAVGTDASAMKNLSFWIKSKGKSGNLQINLLSNGAVLDTPEHHTVKVEVLKYCPQLMDGNWHEVVIPMADFKITTGFNARIISEIHFGVTAGDDTDGSFFFDDIGFDDGSTGG